MKASIRAAREEVARNRATSAAQEIAQKVNGVSAEADALASVSERDKDVERLRQWEATADLLEALAGAETDAPDLAALLDEIETVDGIGPKTVKAIREHFEG